MNFTRDAVTGTYRSDSVYKYPETRHGLIRKTPSDWVAAIYDTDTGEIVQYAGVWSTLEKAKKSVSFTLLTKFEVR